MYLLKRVFLCSVLLGLILMSVLIGLLTQKNNAVHKLYDHPRESVNLNPENGRSNIQAMVQIYEQYKLAKLSISRSQYELHTDCEIIELAVICTNQNSVQDIVVMIKSILSSTRNPVHVHFVTSPETRFILDRLFATWSLIDYTVSMYGMDCLQHRIKWIEYDIEFNSYVKLALPLILPSTVNRVIVLDTTSLVISDIADLWTHSKTSMSGIIGMLDDFKRVGSADNTASVLVHDHPEGNRLMNTAIVIDLQKARSLDWEGLLHDITEDAYLELPNIKLTDKIILKLMLNKIPRIAQSIPCGNVILLNKLGESCNIRTINRTTMSGPIFKHIALNGYPVHEIYNTFYRKLFLYDGNVLRQEQNKRCTDVDLTHLPIDNDQKPGICYNFTKRQSLVYRTHLYYTDCRYEATDYPDVTLVSQLTIERLQMLESIFQHWTGPVSLALFVSDFEMEAFFKYRNSSRILQKRRNICIHVVYKDGTTYPINYLRNVAKQQVKTDFMFLLDVDFLPMYGLYENLRHSISTRDMHKMVLIVPAFEILSNKTSFPKTKNDLLSLLQKKTIIPMKNIEPGKLLFTQSVRFRTWKQGHAPTNYTKWTNTTMAFTIKYKLEYEPYLVVRRDVPDYDERFIDYGWNKVTHAMLLDAQRYTFTVLPTPFIVHMPHSSSKYSKEHKDPAFRKCLDELKRQFTDELLNIYKYHKPKK